MTTPGNLKITLPDDQTIHFVRAFDAPRELVWRALSEPALLRTWMYCPDGWTMTTCEDDVRVGGGFRWARRPENRRAPRRFGGRRAPAKRAAEAFLVGAPATTPNLRLRPRPRWAWSGPNGFAMTMHGTYREVVRPERMVRTETFDTGCEAQAGEQIVTLALAETAGRTTMTLTVRYPSKVARDAALKTGMEHGMATGYDQLDGLLAGPTLLEPR